MSIEAMRVFDITSTYCNIERFEFKCCYYQSPTALHIFEYYEN
jgi:hypothetical protein